ncbi:hypothetical protein STCU_08341 [Strigomonas culicis]|uniref:Uncharacterized protein n=1 Tax=Strigomonas culicis TaxID=28005 RepID=S9TUP7_9TRYP|nr:hypothetical protein STCU_08341 [Strigomonas culicis]|eukprot:EPY22117.1 hypothetical protein STCU_08341 [Strigomonas culicis]
MLEDANYSAVTSRYIAFLFFYVAVFLDRKLSGRVAAMQLLECATNMNGGTFCLLPTAVHNLRMLLIAMNYGKRISHVPIAALSDVPLVLPSFSRSTSVQCAKNILCEQVEFCKACRAEDLLDGVLEAVDAACSLSSVRMAVREGEPFAPDHIDPFVVADTPLAQGAVWLQYAQYVFLLNGRPSFSHLRDTLAASCDHSSVCLALLSSDFFSFFGFDERQTIEKCCEHFAARHRLEQGAPASLPSGAQATAAVHPLEWVSYCLLRSRLLADDAQVAACLDSVPVELLVQDADAATLWAFAFFKHAAVRADMALFRSALERYLYLLREHHLTWWSPLDTWYHEAVGLPHEALLEVYHCVPLLLGTGSDQTPLWRGTVLEVGTALGVLHPLLTHSGE